MSLRYLSLCSGIEAASCAWHNLDMQPVAFSEIKAFPCRVLALHYPDVPNLGDMTKIDGRQFSGTVELVVGGTPCQDFSIAGRRAGLAGERSGLAMHFVRIVDEIKPRWILWENVLGAFSTNGGRDFACFTSALAECGYHICWRVLDAQYFGVPQRRRRIFLVGHSSDWRCAAAVLFELESLRGNTTPGTKAQKEVANCLTTRSGTRLNGSDETFIASSFGGFAESKVGGTLRSSCADVGGGSETLVSAKIAPSVTTGPPFSRTGNSRVEIDALAIQSREGERERAVRRLTPLECERLQGFPDGYTDIPGASDSARYSALGNSMAVPVMRWIGERMLRVDAEVHHGRM